MSASLAEDKITVEVSNLTGNLTDKQVTFYLVKSKERVYFEYTYGIPLAQIKH